MTAVISVDTTTSGIPFIAGPAWPGVRSLVTTRRGGTSTGVYASLNLGDHVGDDAETVHANRVLLSSCLPGGPLWLQQVHGVDVVDADSRDRSVLEVPCGDAAVTRQPGQVLAIMTADCLPVVIAAEDASVLAVAHAGWRGLAAGVLEQTVARMQVDAGVALRAWIGPAIGPRAFEVGDEVRAAFVADDARAQDAFVLLGDGGRAAATDPARRKWLADLPALAARRLQRSGVETVQQSGLCTVEHPELFFSYRRDGQTGRFATLAWIEPRG